MSADLHNAATITPPISGGDGLVVIASSATAAVFRIPDDWLKSWITVEPDGCDCYFAFTLDSTLAVDGTDVTTLSSGAIDTHGTAEGVKAADGVAKHFDLGKLPRLDGGQAWYLAHVESVGSAYLRVTKSSGYSVPA